MVDPGSPGERSGSCRELILDQLELLLEAVGVRQCHAASPPVVLHAKVTQECSADQHLVPMPTGNKMHARKTAMEREPQRRDMHLRKMHVHLKAPVNSAHLSPVNNRQTQLRREGTIDTPLLCAG